jgi:hypothetical protein
MKRGEVEKANINRMGWKVGGRKPKERAGVVSLPYYETNTGVRSIKQYCCT